MGPVLLAVTVGTLGGYTTVLFRKLLELSRVAFQEWPAEHFSNSGACVVAAPCVGGILVGLLVYWLAKEAKGHGVPEVMDAVARHGGRIRPRVVAVKALASAICIGSGGAAGREGPIVQIGSTIGSAIGAAFKLTDLRVKMLVACGAAAGIAGTFNAPIAGVIFALEVILGSFAARSFGLVVLSAVTATAISRSTLGNSPAFTIPAYELRGAYMLPLCGILGALSAVFGRAFVLLLYAAEDMFEKLRVPEYVKPAIGGLAVGLIGLRLPQVFGVGYQTMEQALRGDMALHVLLILIAAKMIATSLTLGSGGSGGVFAPSLFIGAMLGGAFGEAGARLFSGSAMLTSAFALIGMGSLFAATSHAPITAVLILFEMTNDYRIILPLMTAVVTAAIISQMLSPESIYTIKLRRRGVMRTAPAEQDLLSLVRVADVMTRGFTSVSPDTPVAELMIMISSTRQNGFPVVADDGQLWGVVTLHDVEDALDQDPMSHALKVRDIATRSILTCFPDQTVSEALHHFGAKAVGRLPVVSRENPQTLLGVLRRENIIEAYDRASREHQLLAKNIKSLGGLEIDKDLALVEVALDSNSALCHRRVRDISLPEGCLLITVWREGGLLIPDGDTVLRDHDIIVAASAPRHQAALRRHLQRMSE